MPRRDHSCVLINKGKYMLIYGGRNDRAYVPNNSVIMPQMALDDLILFDFAKTEWVGVLQMGYRPEGRWGSSLAYHEVTDQIFIFGGGKEKGSCGCDTYCCELNSIKVSQMHSEYQDGLSTLRKYSKKPPVKL